MAGELVISSRAKIWPEKPFLLLRPRVSMASTEKENSPEAVGIPVTAPLLFPVRPAGRPVKAKVYGGVPPVAANVGANG